MRLDLQSDVSLARFNTFGIDVKARLFVRVESVAALHALRAQPLWNDGPRLVLGGGSNVLFTRDFDGLVIHIATGGHRHLGDDGEAHLVEVQAGESWDGFVRTSVANGWPGLENLALIPGSVGASPVQNIGAYGVELAERFAWLEALDLDTGETKWMSQDDCAFGYRDSVFKRSPKHSLVITRVIFRLPKRWQPSRDYGDVRMRLEREGIADPTPQQMVDVVTAIRREKLPDPAVIGNAGSFFKNPIVDAATWDALRAREPAIVGHSQADGRVKLAAAWLIDRCGWRGRSLPGSRASVHDRQALVLVNRGGADGADIVALATAIRHSVQDRFGVDLEPEPLVL
jgi:UDP-N-acetylmuramate dehydrogenase